MINPKELENDEKYFASKDYMSVSLYKQFLKCEVNALKGFGEPTSSMLVGSYVDAYVSGTLEEFKQEHPEIISSRGQSKGQLKSEFIKAKEICEYINNSTRLSQEFLSGDKQTVMTGAIKDVPFKIKMDSYSKGKAISDLKVMCSVTDTNGNYIDFISKYGYDIQLACYQEIVYQNTGEKLPCFICAVTKETPINSVIIYVPQNYLDIALYNVETNIEHFWSVYRGKTAPSGCGHCSACIKLKTEPEIISLADITQ